MFPVEHWILNHFSQPCTESMVQVTPSCQDTNFRVHLPPRRGILAPQLPNRRVDPESTP
jgi:hypothetical protein